MTMASGRQPQAESRREIRISNSLSEISRVAALVDRFAADHNFSNELVVAINVSLDEVLNNIISYAYEDSRPHDIVVRLEIRCENVEVIVQDDGKPFDPLTVPAPDLVTQPRGPGGVGLHFVRNLTDELTYTRRNGINQLRLLKRLKL
jgi:anti-sigma regulatory factor (Ser/Thr protein kinase)